MNKRDVLDMKAKAIFLTEYASIEKSVSSMDHAFHELDQLKSQGFVIKGYDFSEVKAMDIEKRKMIE